MPLEDYARKRDFQLTPEPPPAVVERPAGTAPVFCVQRHNARRLHYDFRLEANGVLYSWAVPRGPSLDPADKRMAVHTEDHPMDYLDFEGVIPAREYGAGSVMLWDIGTYTLLGDVDFTAQHERGDIKFEMHGQRLRGSFALVRTHKPGGKDWLLIKKRDDHVVRGYDIDEYSRSVASGLTQEEIARGERGQRWTREEGLLVDRPAAEEAPARIAKGAPQVEGGIKGPMPAFIVPMETTHHAPFSDPAWSFDLLYDGLRALAYGDDNRLRLLSRLGDSLLAQFPELESLPRMMGAASWIVDGEIVALDAAGLSTYDPLVSRMEARSAGAASKLSQSQPVIYYVFDLLYLNGVDLRETPFSERLRLLRKTLEPAGVVRLSDPVEGEGKRLYELAVARGAQGIVGRRNAGPYVSGRSADRVAIEPRPSFDCVIVEEKPMWRLGLYDDKGTLHFVGEAPAVAAPAVEGDLPVCRVSCEGRRRDHTLRDPQVMHVALDRRPDDCTMDQDRARRKAPAAARAVKVRPPLLEDERREVQLRIDGHALSLTNLNKVLFPRFGYTKRDLINFYARVADLLLPYLHERPLTLKRYPNGIDSDFFFQKRAVESYPQWVTTELLHTSQGDEMETIICNDRATLIFLANLACIDQNPWMSRRGHLEAPDFLLIDLDPQDCPYDMLVEAALIFKKYLDRIGLQGFPKTSGSRGLHIYVPLAPRYTFDQTRNLAHVLTRLAAAERPQLFTAPRVVDKRERGKVYVDYPQNRNGSTIAAPYVVRPVPEARVATPLTWDEVTPGLHPDAFTIATVLDRFERVGDLYAPVLTLQQALEPAIEALEKLV